MYKNIIMQRKYSAKFESYARAVPCQNKQKSGLAIASLDSIVGVFSEDEKERLRKNPDLLLIASNLALANFANKNFDAVTTEDLLSVSEKFEYKQINSEHSRQDVKGFIDEVGWALYPSNELIDEENVLISETPVQLVIGGYLWRVVDPELCNLIEEASNENSQNYQKVSTSFELLFEYYDICISPTLNIKDGRLIKQADSEFEKFDKVLPQNGGKGKEGGLNVFRVLRDILPVGAGIVRNPASGIKGIAVVGPNSELKDDEPEADPPEETSAGENILEKDKEISVNENKSTNTIMVISSINDIEAQFEAFTKLPAKEATASIQKIMESKILELSTEYAAKEKAKDEALANETKAKADLEARASGLGKAVEELQAKLDEIERKQSAAANEAAFNSRMAALDETFDLDDDDRAILVDEVKALESDAAFMPWMDKKKKLMKEKTKAYKAEKAKCMTDKLTKAGVKFTVAEDGVNVKEIFASLQPSADNVSIPNTPHLTENLADKIKALREGITVAGVKTE